MLTPKAGDRTWSKDKWIKMQRLYRFEKKQIQDLWGEIHLELLSKGCCILDDKMNIIINSYQTSAKTRQELEKEVKNKGFYIYFL